MTDAVKHQYRVLITDLDNTLWDWFNAWFISFDAMLERLVLLSQVPREVLESEIRDVHRLRHTTEYSNLLNEVPALISAAGDRKPSDAYDEAVHTLASLRRRMTRLYPGVLETLNTLRANGVRVIAYTESVAFWTEWRIKLTGLDGTLDLLYSAPDHDLPLGMTVNDLRRLPADSYGLRATPHRHVPRGAAKPNVEVLLSILKDAGVLPEQGSVHRRQSYEGHHHGSNRGHTRRLCQVRGSSEPSWV
jgi:phosphoglycolate phosphatase-like HAD superfamily hydrolase